MPSRHYVTLWKKKSTIKMYFLFGSTCTWFYYITYLGIISIVLTSHAWYYRLNNFSRSHEHRNKYYIAYQQWPPATMAFHHNLFTFNRTRLDEYQQNANNNSQRVRTTRQNKWRDKSDLFLNNKFPKGGLNKTTKVDPIEVRLLCFALSSYFIYGCFYCCLISEIVMFHRLQVGIQFINKWDTWKQKTKPWLENKLNKFLSKLCQCFFYSHLLGYWVSWFLRRSCYPGIWPWRADCCHEQR